MTRQQDLKKVAQRAFAEHGGFAVPRAFLDVFEGLGLDESQVERIAKEHYRYYRLEASFGVGAKYPKTEFFERLALRMIEDGELR